MHVLNVGGDSYVIDVGAFYTDKGKNYPLPRRLGISTIKAVIVTHAHADHIGRPLLLLDAGYKSPIYVAPVTKDLLKIGLASAVRYTDLGKEKFYYSHNNDSNVKPVCLDRFDYGHMRYFPTTGVTSTPAV